MDELTFSTDRLRVGPWTDDDAAWYLSVIDADIRRWTREPDDESEDAWRRRQRAAEASPERQWSRIGTDTGEPVGSLASIADGEVIELRYWIAKSARGNGYAREAIEGAVDRFRDAVGVDRFRLEIHPDNLASRTVAERAGFVFDGFEASCDACADEHGRIAVYVRSV